MGREAELRQLHTWLDKALKGARQLVFVTGEAGIGKTALIEAFLSEVLVRSAWSAVKKKIKRQRQKAKGKNRKPLPNP